MCDLWFLMCEIQIAKKFHLSTFQPVTLSTKKTKQLINHLTYQLTHLLPY